MGIENKLQMSFLHASKAFDSWHSYVQTRKYGLAENRILGCELIGNLSTSQCFVINNERLSSRIRLLLFSTFLLTIRMKKSAHWNHKLHHFERDCSYTGDGIWDSKLPWKWMIFDMKDAWCSNREKARCCHWGKFIWQCRTL